MLAVGAILPAIALAFVLSPRTVESPRWTMANGSREAAEQDLRALVSQKEATEMLDDAPVQIEFCTWSQLLCPMGRRNRQAVLTALVVRFLGTNCGIGITIVYIGTFLTQEGLPEGQVFMLVFFLGCLRLVTSRSPASFWLTFMAGDS